MRIVATCVSLGPELTILGSWELVPDIPYDPWWPLSKHFARFRRGDYRVTIGEVYGSSIWEYVLAAPSTLEMNVLTGTSFFSFYPRATDAGKCVLRSTIWDDSPGYVKARSTMVRTGYKLVDDTEHHSLDGCASKRRRLRHGRGVGAMIWNHDSGSDYYVRAVQHRFSLEMFPSVIWQLSTTCYHPKCPSFHKPPYMYCHLYSIVGTAVYNLHIHLRSIE